MEPNRTAEQSLDNNSDDIAKAKHKISKIFIFSILLILVLAASGLVYYFIKTSGENNPTVVTNDISQEVSNNNSTVAKYELANGELIEAENLTDLNHKYCITGETLPVIPINV